MKWIEKNLTYIFLQTILLAAAISMGRLGLFVSHKYLSPFILVIIEILLLIFWLKDFGVPVLRLGKLLGDCKTQKDIAENLLDQNAKDVIFAKDIAEILKARMKQATLENDTVLLDKQATLTALQSQINPHFLYNTLDTIRGQALVDGNREIAKMVEALAGFFRYSISSSGDLVTVRDELSNVRNYMMIQEYRFDSRYQLKIDIEEEEEIALDYLIPRLSMQPIVENAIVHGLKDTMENGEIIINLNLIGKDMIITVSDNGCGMDSEKLNEINERIRSDRSISNQISDIQSQSRHSSIALTNIHKRIQLLYGNDYGLNIYSTPNHGTDVEIILPATSERMGRT